MSLKYFGRVLVKIAISVLFAGIFYFVWLAAFLLLFRFGNSVVEVVSWLLAPLVTAAGFTTGIVAFEHLTKVDKDKFVRIFIWPLIGCAVGAGAVYWLGPMLIVFGMFLVGTRSVIIRETISIRSS